MLLLILAILFLVAAAWLSNVTDGGSLMLIMVVVGLVAPVFMGATTLPNLVAQQENALSLKGEIETMRGAYYQQSTSGVLVGGSLDNLKQSTELSTYISNYATAKSTYNQNLQSAKIRIKVPFYWWVGDTLFMSKEILNMEKIN